MFLNRTKLIDYFLLCYTIKRLSIDDTYFKIQVILLSNISGIEINKIGSVKMILIVKVINEVIPKILNYNSYAQLFSSSSVRAYFTPQINGIPSDLKNLLPNVFVLLRLFYLM